MLTVNGLDDARSAVQAGAMDLESAPFAACYAGVNYWRAVLQQLQQEFAETPFTFTLCCGDDAAIAHDALRLGFTRVRVNASEAMHAQLVAAAKLVGAEIEHG